MHAALGSGRRRLHAAAVLAVMLVGSAGCNPPTKFGGHPAPRPGNSPDLNAPPDPKRLGTTAS